MAVYVGLDLGTHAVRVGIKGKGVVLCEPSVAAVDMTGNVVAVGTKALLVHSRAPGTVTLRKPIVNGSITDFNLTAEMLDRFLETAAPRQKKHVLAAVNYSMSEQDRTALTDALSDCRTGNIRLVDSALAALSGCDAPSVSDSEYGGTVVCDIGAGSVEVSYIRNGEILRAEKVIGGGDAADREIIAYFHRRFGIGITELQAQELKRSANVLNERNVETDITGVNVTTGIPKRIRAATDERFIKQCHPQTETAAKLVSETLANLPVQGENKSAADRILLVGGGACMSGLGEYFGSLFREQIYTVNEPALAAVRGLMSMLEPNPQAVFKGN